MTNIATKKAIVLFSGGMDSAVALHMAQRDGYAPLAVTFRYGQRHQVEVLKATHYCLKRKIPHQRIDLPTLHGSALTDPKAEVMFHRPLARILERAEEPITYVPARNLIFLSMALSMAGASGTESIYIGVNELDGSGYPDCTPAFIESFQQTANLGTRRLLGTAQKVQIKAPLLGMTKADIVREGRALGVDFNETWSCYDPKRGDFLQEIPCQVCDACQLRRRGFEEALKA